MYSVRGAGRGDPLDQMSMDEGSQTGTRPKRNDSGSGNNTSGQNQIIGKLTFKVLSKTSVSEPNKV